DEDRVEGEGQQHRSPHLGGEAIAGCAGEGDTPLLVCAFRLNRFCQIPTATSMGRTAQQPRVARTVRARQGRSHWLSSHRPSPAGYPRFWGFPRMVGGAIVKKPSPRHSLPQGGGYKRNGRLGGSATGQRSAAAPRCGLLSGLC